MSRLSQIAPSLYYWGRLSWTRRGFKLSFAPKLTSKPRRFLYVLLTRAFPKNRKWYLTILKLVFDYIFQFDLQINAFDFEYIIFLPLKIDIIIFPWAFQFFQTILMQVLKSSLISWLIFCKSINPFIWFWWIIRFVLDHR